MIHFEFDREADLDGSCDMITITPEMREAEACVGSPPPDAHCDADAVIRFTEDGEVRQFCLEHGKQRVRNLANSRKVWDYYAAD